MTNKMPPWSKVKLFIENTKHEEVEATVERFCLAVSETPKLAANQCAKGIGSHVHLMLMHQASTLIFKSLGLEWHSKQPIFRNQWQAKTRMLI